MMIDSPPGRVVDGVVLAGAAASGAVHPGVGAVGVAVQQAGAARQTVTVVARDRVAFAVAARAFA